MAKPIHVQMVGEQIVFYSDYLYSELNKTVSPRKWEKDFPAGPGRDRPGAWVYPADPLVAAKLMRSFEHIFDREKAVLAPEFVNLAASGKGLSALKIDVQTVVQSMSKRCAIASPFIRLRFPYDAEMVQLVKGISGAQFKKDPEPAWFFPALPEYALKLHKELNLFASDEYANGERSADYLALIPDENADRLPIRSKRPPRKHQENSYWNAYHEPAYGLGYDMGAGKTKVAIDLCVNRDDRRVLVVCPKAVVAVWPLELTKDAADGYNPIIIRLDGPETIKQKAQLLTTAVARGEHTPVWVILNYDIVWRDELADAVLEADFDTVIADESHKIKAAGSKVSLFMGRLGRRVNHRHILTGTAMPDSPVDIYGQFRFLDWTIFGPRFKGYYDRDDYGREVYKPGFCDDYVAEFDKYGKPTKYKNLRLLNAKIYRIMDRVKTRDVIDLPPIEHIEYFFDLAAPAKKALKELNKKFATNLLNLASGPEADEDADEGGLMTVKSIGVLILREAQITGGYAKGDDGRAVQVDTGKRDLLAELLEGLDPAEPVVVFCRFQRDLDTVHEVADDLKRQSGELSGRANHLASWQAGDFPVLAVQIQAGGAGVDLTRTCHVFYYSVGYSNGDYEQSLKRSDRPGQTRPVRFYHLLANNSVDIEIMQALRDKLDITEAVLAMRTGGDGE